MSAMAMLAPDSNMYAPAVPPTIDIELVKLLHEIRMDVLQTPGKKLHFQKSVARYCRMQVSAWEEQLASIGCTIACDKFPVSRVVFGSWLSPPSPF